MKKDNKVIVIISIEKVKKDKFVSKVPVDLSLTTRCKICERTTKEDKVNMIRKTFTPCLVFSKAEFNISNKKDKPSIDKTTEIVQAIVI